MSRSPSTPKNGSGPARTSPATFPPMVDPGGTEALSDPLLPGCPQLLSALRRQVGREMT